MVKITKVIPSATVFFSMKRVPSNTIPELKANNIDTELSHKASIGKIASEKLNYLMQRGLDEDSARALLIRSFLEKGIETLPDSLKKRVDKMT